MSEYCTVIRADNQFTVSYGGPGLLIQGTVDDSLYGSAGAYVAALQAIVPVSSALRDNLSSLGNTVYMAKLDGARLRANLVIS